MKRQLLALTVGAALITTACTGAGPTPTPTPTAPSAAFPEGSVAVIPPQPGVPVELWRGEPDTVAIPLTGEPDLLVIGPMPGKGARRVSVVDWRAGRELWHADAAECGSAAVAGAKLACATAEGVDWYDLRSGGAPTRTPLPRLKQLQQLTDKSAVAFLTSPSIEADQDATTEPATFGVLTPEEVSWQREVLFQGEVTDVLWLGVEGGMVFALRNEDWAVWMAAAATATGDSVSIPDQATPPMRIPGTSRLAFSTANPPVTYLTDLDGRQVASADGGPTWSSRHASLAPMANDGSVPAIPVAATDAVGLDLLRADGQRVSVTTSQALPIGLCGGILYALTSAGDASAPTYGLRALKPDGTTLWDEAGAGSFPVGAFCDGTRLLVEAFPQDKPATLTAYAEQGKVWSTEPHVPAEPGQSLAVAGAGLLVNGEGAPRMLGSR